MAYNTKTVICKNCGCPHRILVGPKSHDVPDCKMCKRPLLVSTDIKIDEFISDTRRASQTQKKTIAMVLQIRNTGSVIIARVAQKEDPTGRGIALGHLASVVAEAHPEIFEEWKTLMGKTLIAVIRSIAGGDIQVEMGPEVAPGTAPEFIVDEGG